MFIGIRIAAFVAKLGSSNLAKLLALILTILKPVNELIESIPMGKKPDEKSIKRITEAVYKQLVAKSAFAKTATEEETKDAVYKLVDAVCAIRALFI